MSEKTYSQMRKEFYEAYRTRIVPKVRKFEKERKIRLFVLFLLIFLSFLVGLGYLFFYIKQDIPVWLGLYIGLAPKLIIITTIILCAIWGPPKKGFESKIKKRIMPCVTACYENLEWFDGEYSKTDIFTKSNLVKKYDLIELDDVFSGLRNDVRFEIVETKTKKIIMRDNKGNAYEQTIFDGVILKVDMNKIFTGNTVVKEKQILNSGNSVKDKKLKQTILEDVEFNKKYNVFTDDEVEARYLLTPSFMERLKKVQVAFSADRIDCSFYDKYLLIALHTTKDLFSICSLFKPVDDAKQYFTMYEEIVSIIKLIDHFKLDQKIEL